MEEIDARRFSRTLWLDVSGDVMAAVQARAGTHDSVKDLRVIEKRSVNTTAAVNWHAIFRQLPSLERLDLSELRRRGPHTIPVLEAAAEHCSRVEALIFPDSDPTEDVSDSDEEWEKEEEDELKKQNEALTSLNEVKSGAGETEADDIEPHVNEADDPLFNVLYRAMARWGQSPRRGLRQLSVEERRIIDFEQANIEFLNAVIKYCPRIEYIDGWKGSYFDDSTCFDVWAVPPAIWRAFCSTCTSLREFSWIVVPFGDDYFAPFGATTKPQLRKLRIEVRSNAPFQVGREDYSVKGLAAMFQGLPALADLFFIFQENTRDRIDAPMLMTDTLFLELCRCCPYLRILRIHDYGLREAHCSTAGASSRIHVAGCTTKRYIGRNVSGTRSAPFNARVWEHRAVVIYAQWCAHIPPRWPRIVFSQSRAVLRHVDKHVSLHWSFAD